MALGAKPRAGAGAARRNANDRGRHLFAGRAFRTAWSHPRVTRSQEFREFSAFHGRRNRASSWYLAAPEAFLSSRTPRAARVRTRTRIPTAEAPNPAPEYTSRGVTRTRYASTVNVGGVFEYEYSAFPLGGMLSTAKT